MKKLPPYFLSRSFAPAFSLCSAVFLSIFFLSIVGLSTLAIAQEKPAAKPPAEGASQTVQGYLVDLACAKENAEKPEPNFGAKHSKGCLQMPECDKSGYGVLTSDNRVIKFDEKSNMEARKLISRTNKKKDWLVTATGKLAGDTMSVASLAVQN